jgi:hypothetical protein
MEAAHAEGEGTNPHGLAGWNTNVRTKGKCQHGDRLGTFPGGRPLIGQVDRPFMKSPCHGALDKLWPPM